MKIAIFGIGVAICVALSACTDLLTALSAPEGCYPVDSLSAKQRTYLHVGHGNPILFIGSQKFVCSCYRASPLVGADEQGTLAGAGEQGHLSGAGEEGYLAGADEKGQLTGAGEKGQLAGAGEKSGQPTGAEEKAHLVGDFEEGHLAGAGEEGHLVGDSEEGHLTGAGEQGGNLTGAGEEGHLVGDFAELSCRIVPECPGFQLIGYEPQQIMVLTATGQRSVPTRCVTW